VPGKLSHVGGQVGPEGGNEGLVDAQHDGVRVGDVNREGDACKYLEDHKQAGCFVVINRQGE
jgi:hypothetical protein